MKEIFVGQINEETNRVYFESQLVSSFRDEFVTNCYEFKNQCTESDVRAADAAVEYNRDIESGKLVVKKCKDCGTFFFVTEDETAWFIDRGMSVPVRCPHCRKVRRQNKA